MGHPRLREDQDSKNLGWATRPEPTSQKRDVGHPHPILWRVSEVGHPPGSGADAGNQADCEDALRGRTKRFARLGRLGFGRWTHSSHKTKTRWMWHEVIVGSKKNGEWATRLLISDLGRPPVDFYCFIFNLSESGHVLINVHGSSVRLAEFCIAPNWVETRRLFPRNLLRSILHQSPFPLLASHNSL